MTVNTPLETPTIADDRATPVEHARRDETHPQFVRTVAPIVDAAGLDDALETTRPMPAYRPERLW